MPFDPKKPFELKRLPPPIDLKECPDLMALLETHNTALQQISRLAGSLREIENPSMFLSTFYLQESISSSAVENIHTTIESALEDETKPESERSKANKEVISYRAALRAGQKSLEKYGLSSRTIREVHRALDVEKGEPGVYRRVQNRIANRKRDGTMEIIYTPPLWNSVENLLSNWEEFADRNTAFFPLIKAAICHYQFEAIHPFEDGNGRCGRILLLLQTMQDGLLDFPVLFLSGYLAEKEDRYKQLLLEVSVQGSWWKFIAFMLEGFALQALKTRLSIAQLKATKFRMVAEIQSQKLVKASALKGLADHIFEYPVTHARFMEKKTGIHWQTCGKYLRALASAGVLTSHQEGKYVIFRNQRAFNALIVSEAELE